MPSKKLRTAQPSDGLNYRILGYRDYIGARCLLRNCLYMQAATLASTSLEKYLKAILASKNLRTDLHLDRLDQFRALFAAQKLAILDELDPGFLNILSKAYSLRYYDTVSSESFGFLPNQFIGELDVTIAVIEDRLTFKDTSGTLIPSAYELAKNRKDHDLCDRNFLVENIPKKEFMERAGPAFAMLIGRGEDEITSTISEGMRVQSYEGEMAGITLSLGINASE